MSSSLEISSAILSPSNPEFDTARGPATKSSDPKHSSRHPLTIAAAEMLQTEAQCHLLNTPYEIRRMIFKHIFKDIALKLRLFSQFPKPCKVLDVLLINRQCHNEAKRVMLQQVTFIVGIKPYQGCAWTQAEFDVLGHVNFSNKKPNCPFACDAQRLKVQLEYTAPIKERDELQGYPGLYKMFPKLRHLHMKLAVEYQPWAFDDPFAENGMRIMINSLLDPSYKPVWSAYKHPPLDVSMDIKFWSRKNEPGEPMQRMRTDCLAQIRNGLVEIARTEPGTVEEWRSLPIDAEQWKSALKAVLKEVSKGKLAEVLRVQ